MQFTLDLSQVPTIPVIPLHYAEELDDVRSIIGDICAALAETSLAEFSVSGFGQERWPVDVRTDLPVFLEQLSGAAASAKEGAPFTLDFYEQGLERSVQFEIENDIYTARCESRSRWMPDPEIETIRRRELERMLVEVGETFMRFLSEHAPAVAAHPWIQRWACGVFR